MMCVIIVQWYSIYFKHMVISQFAQQYILKKNKDKFANVGCFGYRAPYKSAAGFKVFLCRSYCVSRLSVSLTFQHVGAVGSRQKK